jgi:hypothetical protein
MGGCGAGLDVCDGSCVDLRTSRTHCGTCGNACAAGEVCAAGSCGLVCPTGQVGCSGRCADLASDVRNCGACGRACDTGEICAGGSCRTACPAGTASCGGRCVDLTVERTHCGRCDNACAPTQMCTGGACTGGCAAGQINCAGACVNTAVDPAHCGVCGNACLAGYACISGTCRPLVGTDASACPSPSAVCGSVCTDLRSDNENCGACGRGCASDRTCVAGMCVAPCSAGQIRCGGTCTSIQSDALNCGACGNTCGAGQICRLGTCGPGSFTSYAVASFPQPFLDACTLVGHSEALAGADDATATTQLPFEFIFYAHRAAAGSTVWFSSNGALGFGSASTEWDSDCLPSSLIRNAIFPFWDDLVQRTRVCTGTTGSAPDRRFVITWDDARFWGDTSAHMTFSAILNESTHTIDLVYGTMNGSSRTQGSLATIGIQDTGTRSTQFSCDTASVMSGSALRFTPL